MRTRHTLNVNATMPGDVNKLIRVLESWQPPALFVMNSLNANDPNNIVVRLRNVMTQWGGKIIYRPYEDGEPSLWLKRSPSAHLDMLAGMNAPWAWFNVGNEPVTKDPNEMRRMSDWYADLATRAVQRGIRVVLPGGFASGTYERDELRAFKSMWQAMGAQRHVKADGWNVVMLGTHEYGHVDPRYHTDNDNIYDMLTPERARAHKFKTKADIFDGDPSDNWLILRTENILDIMAESCNVPRAQFAIDVAITECVYDRMPNIEMQHRPLADALDSMNGEKTYGYPKVKRVLEHLYGKPAAEVNADIWQWMEEVYPTYYRAFCHFSWTRHDDHPHYWYSRYGLEQADDLHAAWTARIPKLGGQPPVTNPTPSVTPGDKGAPVRVRLRTTSFINVRNAPATTATALANPPRNKALMNWYPATKRRHENYDWYWVEVDGGPSGWQAQVVEYPYQQWVTPEAVPKTFRIPAQYPHVVSSVLGDPRSYSGKGHEGMDFASFKANPKPNLVVAPQSGVVEKVGYDATGLGNFIRVYAGDGWRYYLGHFERVLVTQGQTVAEGDVVGHEGSTGGSTGNHVHLTIQHYGYGLSGYIVEEIKNPAPLMRAAPVIEPEPNPPTIDPDLHAALLALSARLEHSTNELIVAQQKHSLEIAEINESIRGLIGFG